MIANMKITKNQFFGLMLMFSAIILSPFYLYSSGLPQPAHVLMLIASIAIIFLNKDYCIQLLKKNKIFVAFLTLIFSINIFYFIKYQKIIFIINSLYWIYGFLVLLSVFCIFDDKWLSDWIRKFILLQLFFILIAYLIGWGGFSFWPRYEFFFNGPNQLAYFALSMLIVYTTLDRGDVSAGLLFAYFLAGCAIAMTGARSIYIAFTPMIFILLYIAKGNFKKQLFLIITPILIHKAFLTLELPWYIPKETERFAWQNFNIGNNTFNRFKNLCAFCSSSEYYSIVYQLQVRGYLRIIDFPQYLVFGAGQGMDERFGEHNGFTYEIHSSLFGLLFYYGLAGLILFLMAIYKTFKNKMNIFLLSPLFVYGLFTYGLRSPYFWLVLGFVAFIPNIFYSDTKSAERISD